MTRFSTAYPHPVISDLIAANDVNVLTNPIEREILDKTTDSDLSPLDYDVCTRRARKTQTKVIATVSRIIGTAIGRIVSNMIGNAEATGAVESRLHNCLAPHLDCRMTKASPMKSRLGFGLVRHIVNFIEFSFTSKSRLTLSATHYRHNKTHATKFSFYRALFLKVF